MPFYKETLEASKSAVDQIAGRGNCFRVAPKAAVDLVGGNHSAVTDAAVPGMGGTCKGAFEAMGYTFGELAAARKSEWEATLQAALTAGRPACLLISWWQIDSMVSKVLAAAPGRPAPTVIKRGTKLIVKVPTGAASGRTNVVPTQTGSVIDAMASDGSGRSVLVGTTMTIAVTPNTGGAPYSVEAKVDGDTSTDLTLSVQKVQRSARDATIPWSTSANAWNLGMWKKYGKHVVYVVGHEPGFIYARDQQNAHAVIKVSTATWRCDDFTVKSTRRGCEVTFVNVGTPPATAAR